MTNDVVSAVVANRDLTSLVDLSKNWVDEKGMDFLLGFVGALLVLVIGGLLVRILSRIVRSAVAKAARNNMMLADFLASVVSKCGWAMLVVVALGEVGIDVGPLVAGLGVTGFVLGFAFKDSLGNLASGIMIAVNHPFDVGDFVLAGGMEGSVTQLNMMATVLSTPDNKKVILPNSVVWGGPVVNYNAYGTRRVDLTVGISYDSDIAKAIGIARGVLAKLPNVLSEPAPVVAVRSLDDSSITLVVRPWVKSADYWSVASDAQQAVKEAFAAEGVTIPFPQLDVHMNGVV